RRAPQLRRRRPQRRRRGRLQLPAKRRLSRGAVALSRAVAAPFVDLAVAGDEQAAVSFAAPASDGGSPIRYYTATASPGGQSGSATTSPISVQGLANGTSYTFTVTATNDGGASEASQPSGAVVPSGPE